MPHCVVEHSSAIDGNTLIPLVFAGALESKLFEIDGSDIKVRAMPYSNYQTGNVDVDFVHVTLKILSGRTIDQKSMLSKLVLEKLKTQNLVNCSISVEVVDIDRVSYSKVVM
ncbi:5-carboxymethyl-2-hydroxymuconate Delta-isomerase [Thalassotalea nanhaiensis]|uniref:5-carboxymethyl-2-hydroxymuconate Delta-isomerase n=1 Tax=Thalassotalea nanhaiensis TaxID=3065648 RepID=A0ABY9TLZ5_9GAMM|nr:5-carboxymethyl-2-hydroxymuconate Delta-isomerase [Colwelliaceae bacterium SQ345]